jgi:hypothetical protein|nr:MAG TPA: hypothetical protein [Caudoviricetes sp.]
MVKKIVIEFEAGNDNRVADRVFESAIKYIRRSGGRVVGMRTGDIEPEEQIKKKNDFRIPDLSKEREQMDLKLVIGNYRREKGIGCDVEEFSKSIACAFGNHKL